MLISYWSSDVCSSDLLSKNQHAYVNKLIEEKGLSGRVRMNLLDYRQLDETTPYDKIASVGMFEHVGLAQLPGYFSKLRRLLRPGGLVLNPGINAGGVDNSDLGAGMGTFIEKYIFPVATSPPTDNFM